MKYFRCALILFLFLFSCSKRNELLQFNLGTDVLQLDWNRAQDPASLQLLDNLLEGLTTYASTDSDEPAGLLRPMPGLAASWTVLDQGARYRFHLRKNVQWTDGVSLEAQHFVDSWERLLSPEAKIPNAYQLFDIENAQAYNQGKIKNFSQVGVKALDKFTLEVKLHRPSPHFLHLVASVNTFPIRLDLMKSGPQWVETERLVTLGPYRIAKYKQNDFLLLERNAGYWGAKAPIRKIICRFVTEPITAYALYENKKLDIIPRDLPSIFSQEVLKNPGYRSGAKLAVSYLVFNTKRPPFDRPAKRRAFIQALDRDLFASFFMGSQLATSSLIPPGLIGYNQEIGIRAEKSESILFRGETIDIRYFGTDTWNLLFQALEKLMLEKLNLKGKLTQMDTKEYRDIFSRSVSQRKVDETPHILLHSLVMDYPDPHSIMNVFTSKSESNHSTWKSAIYDALLERAALSQEEKERARLYEQAQELLLTEEAVVMPLFFTNHQALVRPSLHGVRLNALDKWYFKNISFEDESWLARLFRGMASILLISRK